MHARSRLVFNLRLLLIILSLKDNLPPLSIFFLDSTLEFSLLLQNLFVVKVLEHPFERLVIVLERNGAHKMVS
jgi:hypothetical protein